MRVHQKNYCKNKTNDIIEENKSVKEETTNERNSLVIKFKIQILNETTEIKNLLLQNAKNHPKTLQNINKHLINNIKNNTTNNINNQTNTINNGSIDLHSTKELFNEFPLKNFLEDDKLIQLIKDNFNESDNELFKLSFNLFNQNYNTKNDFIINLDEVYKWIGYARKNHTKRLLINNFIKNRDYIYQIPSNEKLNFIENKHTKGCLNEKTILLNIDTFKKCV